MKACTVAIVSKDFDTKYAVCRASLDKYLPDWDHHKVVLGSDLVEGLREEYPYPDTAQFICAIRPAIVRQFLEQYDKVLFLGADVVFFAPPEEYIENDYSAAIVVPHVTTAIPIDGELPNLASIVRTGHLNTDLVLWTKDERILKFLDWQAEVHKTHCIDDTRIFYDQTWLNCLPFFVDDVKILRNPAYNFAYFNSKERGVRFEDGVWYVNGYEPLVCAQFSGFVSRSPGSMSRHTSYGPAIGDRLKLYELYSESLRKINEGN